MQITKKLYVKNRKEWRRWLEKYCDKEPEIWLIYYKKHSDKPRTPYDDAVEEALCFGWIDSTVKGIDEDSYAQRYSPRRRKSFWSEPNKERVRRLFAAGKMTSFGLDLLDDGFRASLKMPKYGKKFTEKLVIPKDILKLLKRDSETWNNFENFSEAYKRIRIGWIDAARKRPEIFQQRLRYFLKMTEQNKKFGMVQ